MRSKKIILVGTSHTIQRGEKRSPVFHKYIEHLVSKKYKIQVLAEEIDVNSVVAKIASSALIDYLIIEPTPEERTALGIQSLNIIEHNIFMEYDDVNSKKAKDECTKQKENVYRLREKEWLKRVNSINKFPVLIICGAEHFIPFAELLRQNDYEVVEECENWA